MLPDDLDIDSCTDDPDLEEEQVDVTTQKFFVGNLAGNFQTTDEVYFFFSKYFIEDFWYF